jgi:hypothetical protein
VDLSVIVLTNLGTQGLGSSIARGIAKIYIPSISLKTLKSAPEADAKVSKMIKTTLEEILNNKLDSEMLTKDLVQTLSTERSKTEYQRIASFGKIKKMDFVGKEISDDKTIYRYRVETPKKLLLWRFAVNDKSKILQISLEEEEELNQ